MNIMLAIPSGTGMVPLKVISRLMILDKPKGCNVQFAYVERLMVDMARNGMVEQCLMHNADYLFFCDDDQIPDKDILVKMLALDKDIVGCPIASRNGKENLAIYDLEYNRMNEFKKTQKVGAVGMGNTLIKRKVLEEIIKEYPAPFQFETDVVDDIVVGFSEDINFCRRAGELGFETWVIAGVKSMHIGSPIQYFYDGEYKCKI